MSTDASANTLSGRYQAEVLDHRAGCLRVRDELARVDVLDPAATPEAAVFYLARILEALALEAASHLGVDRDIDLFGALRWLADAGMLDVAEGSACHTLRRLGNDARHVRRWITPGDTRAAALLLDRVMLWFFVRFPLGPRLGRTSCVEPARQPPADLLLHDLIAAFEQAEPPLARLLDRFKGLAADSRPRSSVLPALLGELLIGAGQAPAALDLCRAALASAPDDLRLRQLEAWALRLGGNDEAAVERLESLRELFPNDGETLGLLAGTYKRIWKGEARLAGVPADEARERALELYERAWQRSCLTDTYCGVNLAAMSLLAGKPSQAQKTAKRLRKLYDQRRALLAPGSAIRFVGYWDRATLAEVLLLDGHPEEARREYREAMRVYPHRPAWIKTTMDQLDLLVRALGLASGALDFVGDVAPRVAAAASPSPTAASPSGEDASAARDEPAGRPPAPPPNDKTMYEPKPIDTTAIELSDSLRELVELLAENTHDTWARGRLAEGWKHGPERSDERRTHPGLVPYAELSDAEKDYDRNTVTATLKATLSLGFRIER